MRDLFDNAAAAKAASLFSRAPMNGDDEIPGVYSMTFRLPVHMAATIAVMADHAGQSRNEIAQLILSAGITAILRETPDEIQAEISQAVDDSVTDFL